MTEAILAELRELFANIADELIPAEPEFPAPSAMSIGTVGLDRLRRVHPALGERTLRALKALWNSSLLSAAAARHDMPAEFTVITEAVAGIYLTEPSVAAAYGYAGRVRLDAGDPYARIAEYRTLTAPVVSRGWVWHGDGSGGLDV
ncbi:hypothetical protein BST22_06845 [Mycolicibacterium chubuense]|uniref:Uncharacterized protein n=1 Tax=Mycolicibacterium chubuense TaxID=1800 RepID=A0A0J6W2S2_MYCCU|nr:hypothetical protein [Mycolicibacterium chubuense]KMO77610.1 hypothetical protein MCHUDSM44219_03270 [Mycolicibacterium chubuense]ORA54328.1 hypothetical protein BST22_06845 [Mycolicibacterium chubuense]SPX96692.1 Uncharacterised protein [Mycolicibacterium chubuense]